MCCASLTTVRNGLMTRTSAAGGIPAVVTYGVLNDPAGKSQCELDIVASEPDGTVLAIGEAKSGETLGHKPLTRLRHATELLRARDRVATDAQPVLLLFGGAGFTAELTASAAGSDGKIQLIGLDRLLRRLIIDIYRVMPLGADAFRPGDLGGDTLDGAVVGRRHHELETGQRGGRRCDPVRHLLGLPREWRTGEGP